MSKEKHWMDYAQLGLIAGQAAKLNQMSAELSALRESVERQEKQRQRQAQLRQMILLAEELLGRFESDAEGTETPFKRQFVVAYETEQFLRTAGVLPPIGFENWQDMDKATALEKHIGIFRSRLLKIMPENDRRDAELCVSYMSEERELANFILYKEPSSSKRDILIPPGFEVDMKPLADKFGSQTPLPKLRALYKERRDFVRSIVGPSYLEWQDRPESEAEQDQDDDDDDSAISQTPERPVTVARSIGRGIILAAVIFAIVAVLVGLVALFV